MGSTSSKLRTESSRPRLAQRGLQDNLTFRDLTVSLLKMEALAQSPTLPMRTATSPSLTSSPLDLPCHSTLLKCLNSLLANKQLDSSGTRVLMLGFNFNIHHSFKK